MKKGIIDLGNVITIGVILISGLVGYFVNARATDGKIGGVSERVKGLETIMPRVEKSIDEIKTDQKDINSKLDMLLGKYGLDSAKINKQLKESKR